MCGLFGGFVTYRAGSEIAGFECQLLETQEALRHRGPDDRGLETFKLASGMLALGHTRLSIIDLSSAGHQPMHSPDGRYSIVFNGEVFNYRELRSELRALGCDFRTDSDTEVLLAAWSQWGADCLRKLKGMFAFAVFDRKLETLTLARDAFGIKPLFYAFRQNNLYFASEVPAMIKMLGGVPELDLQQAYDYLVFGRYDLSPTTFFRDLKHLLPGHILKVDLKSPERRQTSRWWWPSIEERKQIKFEDAAAELQDLFLANVRLHLRSDVPVGAALSGGLDSSAVVCAIRHLEPDMPIHTFSYVARGSEINEEAWLDLVNEHVKAIPHKVIVQPHEIESDIFDMILAQGEPFRGTSIYAQYRVFQAAREAGVVVTLDGQGADELLAGYHGYPRGLMHSLIEKQSYLELVKFVNQWAQWPGRGLRDAGMQLGFLMTPDWAKKNVFRCLGRSSAPPWLRPDFLSQRNVHLKPPLRRPIEKEARGRRLVESLREALTGGGLAQLLRHGDRNSMRWSVESRVPFLTADMAEFLLQLPEHFLLSMQGETKHVFRSAMRGIVPDEILNRKDKIGFQTPEQNWLSSRERPIESWLSNLSDLGFLNSKAVLAEIRSIQAGRLAWQPEHWRLINYCLW
ncbi:MAG: asparagine synthase (glutamine-hydrolyzing), partial [Bdellovibrionota bacterium]